MDHSDSGSREIRRSGPSVARRRKMTILLQADAVEAADSATPIHRVDHFVSLCKDNWSEWSQQAVLERERSLELVSQYPTSSNISALLDIEALVNKMNMV